MEFFYKIKTHRINEFPILCKKCDRRFKVTISYDKETNSHNPKSIQCKICNDIIPIIVSSYKAK
jgi:hypothetical protein